MALNIPNTDLPGTSFLKGINTGSTLFSRMMQPIIEREKQKQQAEQFAQELALRQQAEARLGANSGLTREMLEQQIINWKHKNDPRYGMQQLQDKLAYIQGLGNKSNQTGRPKDGVTKEGEQWYNAKGQPVYSDEEDKNSDSSGSGVMQGLNLEEIKRALTYQALGLKPPAQSGLAYTGAARHAIDLSRIKKEFGENSEEYKNAKAEYDASLDAKKDLRDIRARTKAGLKSGETEFFDESTGEPLGKVIPLTAKERESEEGNILFNELYPYVYKGASWASGEGAISRLENAASHYKTDPRAKKLFDDFLLAEKMLAATTVNEASTLKAGRTNQTYNRLRESLEAQDIPKIIKKLVKEYQLPASAQLNAAMRYQKALSDARNKARKGNPAVQRLFYDPQKQAAYQQQIDSGTSHSDESKAVIVIDPSGKRFETTESNAKHLPKGWKRG